MLSLDDLRALPVTRTTCAHECTGNGRSYFATQQGREAPGTPWHLGSIGQVTWEGVRLAEVLERLGLRHDAVDVMATGLDPSYVDDDGVDNGPVRRPLPIAKALDDTLLVWGMNGEPLLPDHGFPLRLVVPGWVGVASIKWLGSLEVATRPLESPWNTKWYRMTGGDFPADAPPLTLNPVRSVWELPEPASLPAEAGAVLHGRSWSGAGAVARVEVSVDGGETWTTARARPSGCRLDDLALPLARRHPRRPRPDGARHRRRGPHPAAGRGLERRGLPVRRGGPAPGAGRLTAAVLLSSARGVRARAAGAARRPAPPAAALHAPLE